MSIPDFSNEMPNFTDITDYVDYDGNGTGFELGKGGEILFYDESSQSDLAGLNLHGIGHWSTILIIVTVGIIGNVLEFIMMSHSTLSPLSFSVYLKFLAVADTLILTDELFQRSEIQFYLPMVINIHDALCKTILSYELFIKNLSPWLVVGLTVDRYVCVFYPLKRGIFCTKTKAVIVCCSMIGAAILLTLPSLILSTLEDGWCRQPDEVISYFMFLKLGLSSLIPCFLILVLNIAIIVRIRRSNEFRKTFVRNKEGSTKDTSTRPLVLISVLAFVTLLPVAASEMIAFLLRAVNTGVTATSLAGELWPAFNVIYLFNFAQNFFILMGSSQKYRQIMNSKFRCVGLRGKEKRQKLASSTNVSTRSTKTISMSVATTSNISAEMPAP